VARPTAFHVGLHFFKYAAAPPGVRPMAA